MCWKETAQELVRELSPPGAFALPRRPPRPWEPCEDRVAVDFPIREAMEILGRSRGSVELRLRRLRAGKQVPRAA
jgi:hypothetical protein